MKIENLLWIASGNFDKIKGAQMRILCKSTHSYYATARVGNINLAFTSRKYFWTEFGIVNNYQQYLTR